MDARVFELNKPIKNVYNFRKEEYTKIGLTTGSASRVNNAGNLVFTSKVIADALYLPKSFVLARFEIKKADGAALGADNITFENNWFPRCFSQMGLKIGSTNIETIDYPGESDTMLKLVQYDKTYGESYGEIEGWFLDNGDGGTTAALDLSETNIINSNTGYSKRKNFYNTNGGQGSIIFRLAPLFATSEYNAVMRGVSTTLTLTRVINNEEIFYGGAATTAKISFLEDGTGLEWYIPVLTPSLENEIKLNNYINKNPIVTFPLLKRTCIHKAIKAATKDSWQLAEITNSPRLVLVGFKKTQDASFTINNHKYISYDGANFIKQIRLSLNTLKYPNSEYLAINPVAGNYAELYNYYTSVCTDVFGVSPQLTPKNFRDNYSLFCFDLTSQPEEIKKNGISLKLETELSAEFNLDAYVLILEDSVQSIDMLRDTTTKLE